ncbi:MAG TPA: winged helix-turn-helix domain-containing protein [Cellvibrio sp.]|nr:winged helix-turn-helix domain-containing protein [Cellvibrio sp.]
MDLSLGGYQVGDLRIDLQYERVSRAGEQLPMPKLSFDLLLVLVNAAPELVSIDRLMDQVWPGLVVSPETVTQRIKLLRSALGDDSQQPRYILGVRGRGYRWLTPVQIVPEQSSHLLSQQPVDDEKTKVSVPQTIIVAKKSIKKRLLFGVGLAIVVSGLSLLSLSFVSAPVTIAILPLANLSPDPGQDYFADGLTEDLINQLSRIEGLQVTGRISSFYFKDNIHSLDEINQLLDVHYVLRGGVRRADDQLRITLQLMDTRSGTVKWSGSYKPQPNNFLMTQEEIAASVTKELGLTIGVGDFNRSGMTRYMEAYDYYLLAKAQLINSKEDAQQASAYVKHALDIDPDFSLVAALQARILFGSLHLMTEDERVEAQVRYSQIKAQVRALNPDLPELQLIEYGEAIMQRRYSQAENQLTNYLDNIGVRSANAEGSRAYGQLLRMLGRTDAALQRLRLAQRLEPLDVTTSVMLGSALLAAGSFTDATAVVEKGLAINNTNQSLINLLWNIPLQAGDPEGVMLALERQGQTQGSNYQLATWWHTKQNEIALQEVREHITKNEKEVANTNKKMTNFSLALWAAALGDPQLALRILDQIREPAILWAPVFNEARKLPQFKILVRDIGLLEYWHHSGQWPDRCRPVGEDFECF